MEWNTIWRIPALNLMTSLARDGRFGNATIVVVIAWQMRSISPFTIHFQVGGADSYCCRDVEDAENHLCRAM
jgi:hypothetical protein